ncbi:MAG: hypothetical protein SV765_06945 [Pseudomonadota bacterium]|nr:hypothetical protein [Pseudomonadota bacterium]|tara:strand:- start:29 stop:508 length:480 start_codon:yes stop_codon:yes gene_type:complete
MRVHRFWKHISGFTVALLWLLSMQVGAADNGLSQVTLSPEQARLLEGYHMPAPANYDMNTLSHSGALAVPLVRLQFTAETNLMRGHSLDFSASYQSWNPTAVAWGQREQALETHFSVQAPLQSALDFSQAIREKVERCPEKFLDKLLVNGAVAVNLMSW